jgi:FdhE protein
MAGGFLHKLFGLTPAAPPEVVDAVTALERLAHERPHLTGPAALLSDILPGLYRQPPREAPPPLTADQAMAKLTGGIPLLRGEPLDLDETAFRRRWSEVCAAVLRHKEDVAGRQLADALRGDQLDPGELTRELLAGRPEAVYARAEALGLNASLTATVLRLTLYPALSAVGAALAPLRQMVRWQAGCCPTCGSWPLLGEFRGLEQTRFLRCGLCATGWEFPRLRCPFCGTRDHERLGYFHVEGEEAKYRAATCEDCRRYVKMVSTLAALPPPMLLVEEVATVHLDLAAAERGFAVET